MSAYDVVVIGSGFGGAVAACRLAEAGRRVLVLERGRAWDPESYPRGRNGDWLYSPRNPHRHNGWLDVRMVSTNMVVAAGAGVGGGSLIYANVSIDAGPDVFRSGWPSAIDATALAPYYSRVGAMLAAKPIPDEQSPVRLELMRQAAGKIGAGDRFEKLDLAVTFDRDWQPTEGKRTPTESKQWTNRHGMKQGTCTHCGNCVIGCSSRAKNTLDLNYLAVAKSNGAVIRPLCQVSHLSRVGARWRVHFDDVSGGTRDAETVEAERVILAAGSLGSTEILMRSQFEFATLPNLPRSLGKGWSSNGDFVTPEWFTRREEPASPTKGPTITSAIDFLDGSSGGRYFVEDGGLPNMMDVLFDAGEKSKTGGKLQRRTMTRLHRIGAMGSVMPWFGQAIDGSDGDFYLSRSPIAPLARGAGRRALKLDWNPLRSKTAIDSMAATHRALSRATGGHPFPRLAWSWFRGLVTPHPLGGCNMAASPAAGVVDHAGRVFGHPGLYVMDGSIIPRAVGRNPSKTIAAVAERAVELLIAEPSTRVE
ncbi:FAD-dependent oxidoreductase [Antrihabitans cavernicola]|uniref:Cholesterol oxidase n=1 Tax=Antrihabitans cavernicola TaxID=2495913 RepID=A0A5A7S4L2_9NOCA|nr:GMC family oxidoreductase [Spelaeibacter cavernicola]KAA0017063.1 GMC family oxidoreductase [Spelaeibacter cavernicola]